MKSEPSRTAFRVALRRAAHQLLDSPLVLDDPIALRIIGQTRADTLRRDPSSHQTRLGRNMRAFLVARSRFAEDHLARAVQQGTRQYVLLGAGLDTFAYRNPHPELRVFEVDHPATQQWKRERLTASSIAIPPSVTFAPVDFERQSLADGLAAAGFRADAPAFFGWLGVTMYLTGDAIASTLKFVAGTPPGGGLAFDYAVPKSSLGLIGKFALWMLSRRVARAGEPFRTFFAPADLRARLTALGFRDIDDAGPEELNRRYFANRPDKLVVTSKIGRVVAARLTPTR